MTDFQHTVLCVDDEKNILNSLKRLLRKEDYHILTASSGQEALKILNGNEVHIVITDQRMPAMSGTEFLARVKEDFPDAIRIILTGYTDVGSITDSINKGNVYKFFLKPWNNQNLKLEIRQAIDQYDLIQDNKRLHEKVYKQNDELKRINENLEELVCARTADLELRNQALELSRAILEDIPLPIIGISAEGMVAFINRKVQEMLGNISGLELGGSARDFFPNQVVDTIDEVHTSASEKFIEGIAVSGVNYDIQFMPLSGRFKGKGTIMTLKPRQA